MAKKTIKKYYKKNYKKNKKTQKGGNNNNNKKKNKEIIVISRFKFNEWPDKNVPNLDVFKNFVKNLIIDIEQNEGNTYIHCSAGVGRTGVLYVILKLEFKLESGEITEIKYNDILDEVRNLRILRNNLMVQTLDQFKFIFKYFGVYDNNIEQYYEEYYKELSKVKPTEKCKIYNRYQDVQQFREYTALLEADCDKFREGTSIDGNYCSKCYINAAKLEPFIYNNYYYTYDIKINVFAGQCPTEASLSNFYKMIYHNKITRIIMLTDFVEKQCEEYFPEKNDKPSNTEFMYGDQGKEVEIKKIEITEKVNVNKIINQSFEKSLYKFVVYDAVYLIPE
jgi:protein tyrosine phosphatase